jgi:uncharacterized protein (DUF2267 family)
MEAIDTLIVKNTHILHTWLNHINEQTDWEGSAYAFDALKATLQALRIYLLLPHLAHVGAQLPLIIRGIFFENWKPSRLPINKRNLTHFLHIIKEHMHHSDIDPETAARAVLKTLAAKSHEAEIEKIQRLLPNDIGLLLDKS